jgi:hypothetical protein
MEKQITLEDYWKKRCELAEKIIEETPCDGDICTKQIEAWEEYNSFMNLQIDDLLLHRQIYTLL